MESIQDLSHPQAALQGFQRSHSGVVVWLVEMRHEEEVTEGDAFDGHLLLNVQRKHVDGGGHIVLPHELGANHLVIILPVNDADPDGVVRNRLVHEGRFLLSLEFRHLRQDPVLGRRLHGLPRANHTQTIKAQGREPLNSQGLHGTTGDVHPRYEAGAYGVRD